VDFRAPIESVVPGVRGKLLAALAGVEGGLTLRQLAGVAEVSVARASLVVRELVDLGVLDRRDIGRSALLTIAPNHIVGRFILQLGDLRETVFQELRKVAAYIRPAPAALIVFGSVARGTATSASDLDVVVIRPIEVTEDDDEWEAMVSEWARVAHDLTGNRVNRIDVDLGDLASLNWEEGRLWADVAAHGVVLVGDRLTNLRNRFVHAAS